MLNRFSFTTVLNKSVIRNALSNDIKPKFLELTLDDGTRMQLLVLLAGRPQRESKITLWYVMGHGVVNPAEPPILYMGNLRYTRANTPAKGTLREATRQDLYLLSRLFEDSSDAELAQRAVTRIRAAIPKESHLVSETKLRRFGKRKGWQDSRLTLLLCALQTYHSVALRCGRMPAFEVERDGQGKLRFDLLGLVDYLNSDGHIRLVGRKSEQLLRDFWMSEQRSRGRSS